MDSWKRTVCIVVVMYSHIFCGCPSQDVVVKLESKATTEGNSATLSCEFSLKNDQASLFIFHKLAWVHNSVEFASFHSRETPYKKGEGVVSNYNVSRNATHSVLQLHEVQFEPDSGNYSCEVEFITSNNSGEVAYGVANAALTVYVVPTSSSMFLKVCDRSGFLANGATVTITQGHLHNFSCEMQGTIPQATIRWYLGEELQQTDDSTTTSGGENVLINTTSYWSIEPITRHHDMELKCTASTPQLRDPPPAIQLKLHVKTLAPECDVKEITSTSAVVQCCPAYDSSFDMRTYHLIVCTPEEPIINKAVNGSGTVEFILENLKPVTFYEFEVFTNDSFGLSETSEKSFTTLRINSTKELDISAFVDSNGAISVEGIPASYRTNSSSSVRVERYSKHLKEWVIYGANLKENIFNITYEDVQIRNCEGGSCSDASPAKQRTADAPSDGTQNCLPWMISTISLVTGPCIWFVCRKISWNRLYNKARGEASAHNEASDDENIPMDD
ncbi:uncharacterized protein LOC117301582 [Asterias rubens]|uniref:uncharacterized protein LOC117301582 n=1 Tax=Asterias rubens TaxID=7604 RepID=UPI001455D598|nr:uncharacterized protein LOC117301582 [Asterias rubens]